TKGLTIILDRVSTHLLLSSHSIFISFFFLNHTPTPELYPLSLHDALPISLPRAGSALHRALRAGDAPAAVHLPGRALAAAQFHRPRAPALPDGHQRQGLGAEARGRLDPPAG